MVQGEEIQRSDTSRSRRKGREEIKRVGRRIEEAGEEKKQERIGELRNGARERGLMERERKKLS